MKWVTRRRARVNRVATAWLVRRFIHRDAQGRCSFEALAEEHRPDDVALRAMARIVHCADFPDEVQDVAEAAGLRAISRGFPLVARDDHEALEKASFLYDALYAALQERAR